MKSEDFLMHLKVLGWLNILGGGLFLAAGIFLFLFFAGIGAVSGEPDAARILGVVGFAVGSFLTIVSLPGLIAGWGLLERKPWARILGIVVAILNMFAFPVGTAVGVYALWILTDDRAREYFRDSASQPEPQAAV